MSIKFNVCVFCLHMDYFQLEQQGNGNNNPAQRKSPTEQPNIMPPSGVIMPLLDAPTSMPPQMAPTVNRDPRTAAQQHQQQQQQQQQHQQPQMMVGNVPSLLGAPPPGLPFLAGKILLFSLQIYKLTAVLLS